VPKNPRSPDGKSVLNICARLYRETEVIFRNSSSSCIEPYIYNNFKKNVGPFSQQIQAQNPGVSDFENPTKG